MAVDLYCDLGCSSCRAVIYTARVLGLELNLIEIDLVAGDQMKDEFLAMNPEHLVPTINDNGFCLGHSRAISMYLADAYGQDDSLYPKDPKKRAIVNQRLFYDANTLYKAYSEYLNPYLFAGVPRDPEKFKLIAIACSYLDKFLENQEYVAGDQLTIADIAICTTLCMVELCQYDFRSHGNINRWFEKVRQEIPEFEELNDQGMQSLQGFIDRLGASKNAASLAAEEAADADTEDNPEA